MFAGCSNDDDSDSPVTSDNPVTYDELQGSRWVRWGSSPGGGTPDVSDSENQCFVFSGGTFEFLHWDMGASKWSDALFKGVTLPNWQIKVTWVDSGVAKLPEVGEAAQLIMATDGNSFTFEGDPDLYEKSAM